MANVVQSNTRFIPKYVVHGLIVDKSDRTVLTLTEFHYTQSYLLTSIVRGRPRLHPVQHIASQLTVRVQGHTLANVLMAINV